MSRPPRFFITPEAVAGDQIVLTGEDARHIAVLRMQQGDQLSLCDGKGNEYLVAIAEIRKHEIVTEISSHSALPLPPSRVTLCQGLPKSDKMDWIVQKATELGVDRIVPVVTERTIVKVKDEEKRITRWQKIAKEAAMQSNRVTIPQIETIISFRDCINSIPSQASPFLVFPWEDASAPISKVLGSYSKDQDIMLLIGPEGGFSRAEAERAKTAGFHLVSLGQNILRTETAAVALLSMVLYEALRQKSA